VTDSFCSEEENTKKEVRKMGKVFENPVSNKEGVCIQNTFSKHSYNTMIKRKLVNRQRI
jgi:hypothetical protein